MNTYTRLTALVLVFAASCLANVAAAQNFPADGSALEITTCQTTIFDPGGPDEEYPDEAEGFIRLCPEGPAGSVIQLQFREFATELDFDFLQIYNGPDQNAPLIAVLDGARAPRTLTSTSPDGCLYLRFLTDDSFTADGFAIDVVCIETPESETLSAEGGRLELCDALLFDTGGPQNPHENNESWEYTICPEEPGRYMRLVSEAVNLDAADNLYVFNGADFDQLLKVLTEDDVSLDVVSRSPDGCLSLRFISDNTLALEGFQLFASCEAEPGSIEPTDCINAVSICRATYAEDFAPLDEGFSPSEINGQTSCLADGEQRGVWYRFTVLQGGNLGFVITPDNLSDDYDWTLFNLTDASCEDIFEDPELEISCNYNGQEGETGMTEEGERDRNSDGPGESKYNRLYEVEEGQEFVLYVSSFAASSSGDGYTIDFSRGGGDADIFDPNVPGIDLAFNCNQTTVVAEFSEPAICDSLSPGLIRLTDGATDYAVSAVSGAGCVSSSTTRALRIELAESLPANRELTLTFAPGALADDCQNANADSVSYTFTSVAPLGFRNIAKRNTFGGDNNGAVFLNGSGGTPPYLYSIDELFFDTPRQFRELFPEPYVVYIEDARGCREAREINIR